MATIKITDLTETTTPGLNDVLPIVDVATSSTKKVRVTNLVTPAAVLPTAGTTGQALVKNSNTTGDVKWGDVQPLHTSLTNITNLAGTSGTLTKTGSNTWTLDTTAYAPLASPTFTGVPAAPTPAADTNTTQIATTAYVVGQGYLKSSAASSTYAPLASPTFTGTPAAPTASVGTNTTQIATTAFVVSQIAAQPAGMSAGKAIAISLIFG